MKTGPKKIIVVDDSEIFRAGLRELINTHDGLKVVAEAESAERGIEIVKNVPADLVLLDLSLPKHSGFEVLKKIRAFSAINVLILSIYESREMVKEAEALGAQGYCVKDASRKELIKAILDAAEGRFFACHKPEWVLTVKSN